MNQINNPSPFAGKAVDMAASNPANAPEKAPRKRIPMALPTLKLSVPEIPGYKCYWFRGTPARIQQAKDAGYEFVERDEIHLNHGGLANSYDVDGNTDMGTRVSVATGDGSEGPQNSRLYLMKIRNEHWEEDEADVAKKHELIAAQMRGDKGFAPPGGDTTNRYSRGDQRNLFTPRRAT
jgi:hypothetical protein